MALREVSFSLWCDFIERDFLDGEFRDLIQKGFIKGATSNPSIFASSILNSRAYQQQIVALKGMNSKQIYEALAIEDIKKAADILKPLWNVNKDDGYISIEIDPFLGEDAGKSIDEGKRLYRTINQSNVMIKVPATQAGYEVMDELIRDNIPVNATLIFSPKQACECAEIFKNARKKPNSKQTRAVISVFVSRFDRASDLILKEKAPHLCSKLGVLNAMKCYDLIEKNEDVFMRTLFASTGVKGDDLVKNYYIDSLLFEHCVNTAPLETIRAYLKNDSSEIKKPLNLEDIDKAFGEIRDAGIDIESLYVSLMKEGLEAFMKSFEDLLHSI
ncbi:transaldolase [Helicobacter sp. 13S00477-4]|nr:transaldolase [Helicobacter sp. 13S00477-4]PAF51656.1 transaldolase [Helicobacter sp. 13S00477-4]